ncbi:MAG: hypothetical protein VX248_06710 [Pseudomonadota bacterium]|nr:hypothetical protein [Pseudomonadota bacterium]
MKQTATALLIALSLSTPVAAADDEDGFSLMERGMELFFRGMISEIDPALEELKKFMDDAGPAVHNFMLEMGPRLGAILDEVEDWSVYEAPEMLPNGDIIIRRKPDAPKPLEDGEIEL